MTVRAGPTYRNAGCVSAGFNSNNVRTYGAHAQGCGYSSFDLFGTHRAVQQQDLDRCSAPRELPQPPYEGRVVGLVHDRGSPACPQRVLICSPRPILSV
jgi:hypothetical protein